MKVIALLCFIIVPLYAPFYTINRSGNYALGANIRFNPITSNDAAIVINADNVTLDLANYTISQANLVTGCHGIMVNPSLENIVIQNGTVSSLTGTGIIVSQQCQNVTLSSITTFSCDGRGIDLIGLPGNAITGATIKQCTVAQCCKGLGTIALGLQYCTHPILQQCTIKNNGVSTHRLSGVRLYNTTNAVVQAVTVQNNIASTPMAGFELDTISSCNFDYCISTSNVAIGSASSSIGFSFATNVSNNRFNQCTVTKHQATGATARFIGFNIVATNNVNELINCSVTDSVASATCLGIFISNSQRITCSDCLIKNLNATNATGSEVIGVEIIATYTCSVSNTTIAQNSAATVRPIVLANVNATVVDRCICTNNIGTIQAVGLSLIASCDNCVVSNNLVSRSQGPSAGSSVGFFVAGGALNSNMFFSNFSLRNGNLTTNQYAGMAASQFNAQNIINPNAITQPWTSAGLGT